jgi:hypothetical protein
MLPCSSMLNRGLPALSRWRPVLLVDVGFFVAIDVECDEVVLAG